MDPGIDFEFTATFEVFPNVVIGDLGQLQVRQAQAEITEDDMKNYGG